MEAKAIAKYVRVSSRKMKPVCDLIRGKSVEDAQAILRFTPRKTARMLLRVLDSAVANAENNHELLAENLYVKEVFANQGPLFKRYKAGSRGSASPILHRTSHLGVVVAEKE
ncbi:50S ribosomal protein L22 [Guggenheimella bovis]